MSAKIQIQIIYGTKLIANSATKLSRKKYSKVTVDIDIRRINSIQTYFK